ncbi:symmetrical bis(5'-nucleosyl)-tetraphosphatase [Achromobacter sp. NPDC058515]|uniref:symmetrical bis(5'-nucleosyl)-tetraphosphatase n=1 Tax=Achromobacter sp. NPDC058515 TaxID=3346533 RepID=UPI003654DC61
MADAPGAPSIWVVGDVHGCCASLDALLSRPEIADDPECRLWFVGDLVNRGPESAATLRRVMALGDRATVVLGNHDLRALGIAAGCMRLGKRDTLKDLIDAPDAKILMDWLRHRPLMHAEAGHILAHAGIFPHWDAATAISLAGEVETLLRDDQWRHHMRTFNGPAVLAWRDKLQWEHRTRFIVSAFTRMRLCTRTGELAPTANNTPGCWPRGTLPWFDVPGRLVGSTPIIFGHWATLGLLVRSDVTCVDTGCVTGGVLTALRLSDRKLLQVGREPLISPSETPVAAPIRRDGAGSEFRRAWSFQAGSR